ncbi:MAG: copper resistance protein B [Proteobacteria bacterium]|nr:MAG: copper resistance protein B [Pseudomonadota bacterium]
MPAHMHGDDDLYSAILADRLEVAGRKDEKPVVQFEAEAWLGKTFQKLLLRTEGEVKDNRLHESENELLWTQSISPYWDLVAGLKYDAGEFAGRGYAAFGLKGLAPYWFESQATLYVGEQGIILLNAELEYDLLFTQRLILSPRLEIAAQTQSEDDHGTMSGFTKAHYGLRLRYEIWRQFAPYIGIERQELMGQTAQIARASGSESGATDYVLGLRFWF